MNPEPVPPRQNVQYEDAESSDQQNVPVAPDTTSKSVLLAQVLEETLSRQFDDPAGLIKALKLWRNGLESNGLDRELCCDMVGQVLRYRIGKCIDPASTQMQEEIGGALWENPESQSRMQRLWKSLGAN